MPYVRQLESKKWAATVRTPAGRITKTFRLKSQADDWADEQETDVRRGDWIDPRHGEITVGEWWPRVNAARGHLELASRKREQSHWRNHVEPYWKDWQLAAILKPDVQAWIEAMKSAHTDECSDRKCRGCKVGRHTIHGSVSVLTALLELAVDSRLLRSNPARNLKLPRLPVHLDRVFEAAEEGQLLCRLDELFPGRPDARLFVELLFDSGVRWEEAAALSRDVWDMRRGRFEVAAAMESDGTIRPYGKRDASNRPCAVSQGLWTRLRPVVMATEPGGLVFRSPNGHGLRYSNWHRRVWTPALHREEQLPPATRPPGKSGPTPRRVRRVPYLSNPQPTPHDCRHTYGTRLADEGVPEHDIAELMGHADRRSTRRYVHSGDGRFDKALAALERARRGA